MTLGKLFTHTRVPLSPSSISCQRPKSRRCSAAKK